MLISIVLKTKRYKGCAKYICEKLISLCKLLFKVSKKIATLTHDKNVIPTLGKEITNLHDTNTFRTKNKQKKDKQQNELNHVDTHALNMIETHKKNASGKGK